MMKSTSSIARVETGVRNLDALLFGGLPRGSVVVLAGSPGTGKTILTQQLCFHAASSANVVLYFNTLSEPTAKALRNLAQFSFFDDTKVGAGGVQFVDLGVILRTKGLAEASTLIMDQVKKLKPGLVVIDSFKVFDDLARSPEEQRKFDYELAVNLMAWEVTTLLLGEYAPHDINSNPLFSIVDGVIMMSQRVQSGEQQRFLQVLKLRGTAHSREEHTFAINANGIEVLAPRITIKREDRGPGGARCRTGIVKFDELLGEGISRGSSLLIAGVAGTGKTVLLLEFIYRGAMAGEKGVIFSFEETQERLLAAAQGLGWDLQREIDRGMVDIVFIAQPDIMVEHHLLMIRERVESSGAQRVAIDSISVFLHKVKDAELNREKVFQLASIVQNTQAVGFFATDIPYGAHQISRFGVEETVVDGIILLSSVEEGFERERYIEVYKLRNTAHLQGRHNMLIGVGGISVFLRYGVQTESAPQRTSKRLYSGVPGLDAMCGGGLLERSVTLVSGSAGIGKTTLGLQFIVEGARRHEPGLYVSLEEGPAQLLQTAEGLGLPLQQAMDSGLVEVVYLSSEYVRASQFLTLLDDKIRSQRTRRLVIDSISHMAREGQGSFGQLLYAMVMRFKASGVTSVLTLESDSMVSTDRVTERGYSPVADNILMLRYARAASVTQQTISVVKTRGSEHDWETHRFSTGPGGLRIEPLPAAPRTPVGS
jgi:circadian clock protein KaiC